MAKKRGRPKKPTIIKMAEGTYRKDRDGDKDAEPKGKLLKVTAKPPVTLDRDQLRHWKKILEILVPKGLATTLDELAIVRYCMDIDLCYKLRRRIKKDGMIIKGRDNTLKSHPGLTSLNQIESRISGFESKFGMTPTDRAGMHVDDLNISSTAGPTPGVQRRDRG